MLQTIAAADAPNALVPPRTSELLRSVLSNNPDVQSFSVERIVASLGQERAEASLILFAAPAMVPVQVPRGVIAVPTTAIGGGLLCGSRKLKIPGYILRKQISRRALAIAIHALAPVLEAAERIVRPRWHWVSHPISRRAIGFLIFLLGCALAYPLAGSNALHALSLFVMSLGLAEADGLTILIGVAAGVLSLAVVAAGGFSPRALRAKLVTAFRKLGRKLGLNALARFLDRLGFKRVAKLLTISWSDVVMQWDPERQASGSAEPVTDAAPASDDLVSPRPPLPVDSALARAARRRRRSPRSRAVQLASL